MSLGATRSDGLWAVVGRARQRPFRPRTSGAGCDCGECAHVPCESAEPCAEDGTVKREAGGTSERIPRLSGRAPDPSGPIGQGPSPPSAPDRSVPRPPLDVPPARFRGSGPPMREPDRLVSTPRSWPRPKPISHGASVSGGPAGTHVPKGLFVRCDRCPKLGPDCQRRKCPENRHQSDFYMCRCPGLDQDAGQHREWPTPPATSDPRACRSPRSACNRRPLGWSPGGGGGGGGAIALPVSLDLWLSGTPPVPPSERRPGPAIHRTGTAPTGWSALYSPPVPPRCGPPTTGCPSRTHPPF